MISRKSRRAAWLLIQPLFCMLGLGCGTVLPHFLTPAPYTDGTWTGRYVAMTVRDHEGQEYEAAGLSIESGPRTLGHSGDPPFRVSEGAVAFLSRDGNTILDPEELGVEVGTRVRVGGTMSYAGVGVRVEDLPGKPKVFRGVTRTEDAPPGGALMIRLRGKPKVLREPG